MECIKNKNIKKTHILDDQTISATSRQFNILNQALSFAFTGCLIWTHYLYFLSLSVFFYAWRGNATVSHEVKKGRQIKSTALSLGLHVYQLEAIRWFIYNIFILGWWVLLFYLFIHSFSHLPIVSIGWRLRTFCSTNSLVGTVFSNIEQEAHWGDF